MKAGRIVALAAMAALMSAPAMAQKKVKIGFINTFSGPAIFGKHTKDALELGLDHLGRKLGGLDVEVIYGDDKFKPDVGRQAAEKMVKKDKVDFVTGIIWSNVLAATQKMVVRNKTFLISTNAGWSGMAGKNCSPYFFSTSWQNDQTPEAMGKLMTDEGLDNVFLVSANYQAGKDMLTGFERYYKGNVVGRILYRLGQRDFQAELSQIRAAKPSVIFGFLPGGDGIAFVKQYRAAGLGSTIPFYSAFTVNYLSIKGHGKNAIGTWTTSYWDVSSKRPDNQRFIKDFIKRYGYHPSIFSAQSYDLPFFLDQAISAVNGDLSDKKGLIKAMENVTYLPTKGKFRYNTNHMPIQNFYKLEWVADENGDPKMVTRGVVFRDHADSYAKKCKMKRP
jgi:branched-chain amino acid transport system substrate-binding protein